MTPAEIIAQVRPCNMEKPYIFISYSAMDHPRVWEDVLMFQKLGYNVWLDEKNLDKTKESWKIDALNAISDLDCRLVVFYVSRSSLTSENCYDELKQTTETLTTRIHFGPVPFIAVDVEEVGDIGVFTQRVYEELMRSPLSKKEKTDKAIVLSKFTDNFFNSNNERVRVHPKDEPNRKLNYYEEIVASFPGITRVYPEEIEAPWVAEARRRKAAEEEAKRKAEEEEAKRKAEEEEARRKAEAEAKQKAEEDAKRKAAEEEARRKAEEAEEARRKAEEDKRKKQQDAPLPDAALADQVSKLLSRQHELLGWELEEEAPAEEPSKEEKPEKKEEKSDSGLSLEELIRRRLDADKKK